MLYLDLRGASAGPLDVREIQAEVIRAFDRAATIPANDRELADLFRVTLSGTRGLLMLDDARDAGQIRPCLPPSGWAVIVTSRHRFHVPGLHTLDLGAMTEQHGRGLLQTIATRLADDQADEIARLCGRLPLALRLAGSTIQNRPGLDPAAYIRRLSDQPGRIDLLEDESRHDPTVPGIHATLRISYDFLIAELQASWRALAVFPASFDIDAVVAVWDRPTGIDAPDTSHQVAVDRAGDHLDHLVRYSLVEADQPGRYRLHDLARLFAARLLADEERQAVESRHARHHQLILDTADRIYMRGGEGVISGLALFDLEWPSIKAGQAWASLHAANDEDAARLTAAFPRAGAYILSLRLDPRSQITWLKSALSAARSPGDRRAEGFSLTVLGTCYADLGEPRRAIELYEQALVIARRIGYRGGEGANLDNLGNRYAELGDPRRAIELHEQALAIYREIGDRRAEGNALGNLGNCFTDLREPRRAISLHEQQLIIAREIGDRRAEGNAVGNLGNGYAVLGEPRRAIELYEQALLIFREIGDRGGEGSALGNLGNCHAALGEPRQAIELYEQALVICREIGNRGGEGSAQYNVSLAHEKRGDLAAAIQATEASLRIREEIEDPRTESTRDWLRQLRAQLAPVASPEGDEPPA